MGWVQFERLCDEVLRLEGQEPEWDGRADLGRFATVGETVLAVVWVRPRMRARLRRRRLLEQLAETLAKEAGDRRVRVFTNLVLEHEEAKVLKASAGYVGPQELSVLLDREPRLRRRVPSVLGVRDLDGLLPAEAVARSTGDLAAARDLARVVVPTHAYERALATLERHRFAVLSGPPEMGKTAIARTLALALLSEGWEVHECVRPDEFWQRYTRERSQVFIADDAFGSTEYRPEAAERWAMELGRVLYALDERHWLIWTSRPTPLRAGLRRVHREHGVERWPRPAEVQVAADQLDVEEKALILFRHLRAARTSNSMCRSVSRHGWLIVSHRHFTPERIRRFVVRLDERGQPLDKVRLAAAVESELREPTEAMRASLRALPHEYRVLLTAMLDVPPGPVTERDLGAAARRHLETGLPKPAAELVGRLTDHFVRVTPPASVSWIHPSWRDLVIDELGADEGARRRFLAHCSLDGILLALSTGGGATGERTFPLMHDDRDWDAIADRVHELLQELGSDELARLLRALADGLDRNSRPAVEQELEALAAETLAALVRRWDRPGTTVSPTVLEAWFELRAMLPHPSPEPDVGATWRKLLPTRAPSVYDADELHAFEDWLNFATVVRAHAPDAAAGLGFPYRQADLFDDLIQRAHLLLEREPPPPTAGLLANVLRRIGEHAPELAPDAASVAGQLAFDLRRVKPIEPARPIAAGHSAAGDVVARILRDL